MLLVEGLDEAAMEVLAGVGVRPRAEEGLAG
jgi:hypothetical protein